MENKYVVDLRSIDKICNFVTQIDKLDSNVDVIYQQQKTDAKSIIGLIAMASIHIVDVVIHSSNNEELIKFKEICKNYEVKDYESNS